MARNWVAVMVQLGLLCLAARARATSTCPHFNRATFREIVTGQAQPRVHHVIFTARDSSHADIGDPTGVGLDPSPEPDEFASWKIEPTTAPTVRCRFYLLPDNYDGTYEGPAAAAATSTGGDGDADAGGVIGLGGADGPGGASGPAEPGDEEARRQRILLLKENLARAGFDAAFPTTILIHGYRLSGTEPDWIEGIAAATLEATQGRTNVIAVDWIKGASTSYTRAVRYARVTAAATAALIRDLTSPEVGVREQSLHLVGASLGAHVAGFVGQSFQGRLGRITALDAAGPSFSQVGPADRLDPSDAAFVDAIHTDGDNFGIRQPVGHVDFYVNGGEDQPGCGGFGYQSVICDHMRAVRVWMSALRSPCGLRAFPCDSLSALGAGGCLECRTERTTQCPLLGLHTVDAVREPRTWPDNSTLNLQMLTGSSAPYCVSYVLVEVDTSGEAIKGHLSIKFVGQKGESNELALFKGLHNFVPERGGAARVLALHGELGPLRLVALRFSRGSPAWNLFRLAAPPASHPGSTLRLARLRVRRLLVEDGEQLCLYMLLLRDGQMVATPLSPCRD